MRLRRISVENFRGIREATLHLDPSTAIIGENGSGKTTFLDALSICLSGRDDVVRLEARDFHHADDGTASHSLRIELAFQASEHEWHLPRWARFASFVRRRGGATGDLCFEVRARRDEATNAVQTQWTFASRQRTAAAPQAGLLADWRLGCPVIRLRGNRYIEPDSRDEANVPREAGSGDQAVWHIEEQIRFAYKRLGGGAELSPQEAGSALEAVTAYLGAPGHPVLGQIAPLPRLATDLAEVPLGRGRRPAIEWVTRSAGMRGLALVALVGAIIEARRHGALADHAQPIVVLEDAEAHLHPMALSAMWELIASLPAQKIITTNSGELLARLPLRSIRRLAVERGRTRVYSAPGEHYSIDDLRRIAYHIRINRAAALFARCWILVEGETEAWILPELAQLCGYDLAAEGVRCVEFAQSGIRPLLRLATDLGIEWHLLADGDSSGQSYVATARKCLGDRAAAEHITALHERDIEHCLFEHGFAAVYGREARVSSARAGHSPPRDRATPIIVRAVKKRSKPGMALAVLAAANRPDGPPVPEPLRNLIETAIRLARGSGAADA